MLNKAKKSFGFRNVWNLMDEFPLWLKVPQNLQSLEIKQKWLVSSYGKIWDLNSCFVLLFLLLIFLGGNYLRRQFFTCKFIILFSYNGVAPLIFCFDLISTKKNHFFLVSQFDPTLFILFILLTLNVTCQFYFPNVPYYITSC